MLSRAVRRAVLPLCVLGSPLALVATAPSTVLAQEPAAADSAQRVHTVKKHDTLWDIAKTYLGDPFQWPEVYRVNRDVVENPHWIYPGEKLRIPGSIVAAAPAPDRTPAADSDAMEPAAAAETSGPTVFATGERARRAQRTTFERTAEQQPPRVRSGEYLTAPWVDARGGPREAGRIIETNDMPGIDQHTGRTRLQAYDEVLISAPAGSSPRAGTRYVAYELGPYIDDVGQIVVPTGMVEVVRAPNPGEAAVARVLSVYGDMHTAQQLIPYDTSVAEIKAQPRPVEGTFTSKVRWISQQPVLPTVQSYVVLDATADQGVKPGDEFALFRPRRAADPEMPIARPEVLIAKGEVIRVTPFGTTVLLTQIDQPKIEPGTHARVSAKMP